MSKPCANCGAEVPEGASICDNCGMPVSEEAPTQEAPPPQTSTVSPSPGETPVQGAPPRRRPLSEDPVPPPPVLPPPPTIPSATERQPMPVPPRRGGRSRGQLLVLGGGLAALLALGVAVWFLTPYFRSGGGTLEVPSLEGRTLEEARRLAGRDFEVVGDGGPRSVVESQEPAPGEQARRGAEISVVLGGDETVAVPDVVGRSRAEAEELLRSEGFEVRTEGPEDGEVLEQSLSGEAEEGSMVEILVGEPRPASGYALVADDTGALSLEVPVGWAVVTGPGSEEGVPSWSSFLGESVETSVTAAPDLDAWHNSAVTTGMYAVASRTLAAGYTNEELVVSGPNDFSAICTLGGDAIDFDRPPYLARIQAWRACNGDPESFLMAVAVAPEDRECVVAMQIGTTSQTDRDIAQHIIDTAEVDCVAVGAP
jgi:hypothetical protein